MTEPQLYGMPWPDDAALIIGRHWLATVSVDTRSRCAVRLVWGGVYDGCHIKVLGGSSLNNRYFVGKV